MSVVDNRQRQKRSSSDGTQGICYAVLCYAMLNPTHLDPPEQLVQLLDRLLDVGAGSAPVAAAIRNKQQHMDTCDALLVFIGTQVSERRSSPSAVGSAWLLQEGETPGQGKAARGKHGMYVSGLQLLTVTYTACCCWTTQPAADCQEHSLLLLDATSAADCHIHSLLLLDDTALLLNVKNTACSCIWCMLTCSSPATLPGRGLHAASISIGIHAA